MLRVETLTRLCGVCVCVFVLIHPCRYASAHSDCLDTVKAEWTGQLPSTARLGGDLPEVLPPWPAKRKLPCLRGRDDEEEECNGEANREREYSAIGCLIICLWMICVCCIVSLCYPRGSLRLIANVYILYFIQPHIIVYNSFLCGYLLFTLG